VAAWPELARAFLHNIFYRARHVYRVIRRNNAHVALLPLKAAVVFQAFIAIATLFVIAILWHSWRKEHRVRTGLNIRFTTSLTLERIGV